MTKIGIIGGSGLEDPDIISECDTLDFNSKYGKPSSRIITGKISNSDMYIIARHGKNHQIPPHIVNYRANISALKELGCEYIIATTAVGSLREEIKPCDLVFPDQFIDFTRARKSTFYDIIGNVKHTPMSEPFDKTLREIIYNASLELGYNSHKNKTVLTINGPRFSTKAESKMFRQWGADIINMSTCPEVILANEAKIPYQAIAMSTDYDCWKEDEEPVTWEIIEDRMNKNADKVKNIILKSIFKIEEIAINKDSEYIKSKIRTIPDYPKKGIMFRDITTLLNDSEAFRKTLQIFKNRYINKGIDVVAGIESRGFIFGGALAEKIGANFVPIRKKGKLPYETVSEEYDLEYGKDRIEIHKDSIKPMQKVLIMDDLIATGGTVKAACSLVEKIGGNIVECAFVIELPELKGREKLNKPYFSIVKFEGE